MALGSARVSRRTAILGGGAALVIAAGGFRAASSRVGARVACQARELGQQFGAGSPRAAPDWQFATANPVLDVDSASEWENSAVFDPCVVRVPEGGLAMWYTTRGSRPDSVQLALDPSGSGDTWQRVSPTPVLTPDPPERPAYEHLTRPSVLRTPDGWRMWYSVVGPDQDAGACWIGTATSPDGLSWRKHGQPVLRPTQAWEARAVQAPNVWYEAESDRYLMWYSGGEVYEPDAVGLATSSDGVTWTPDPRNPIFVASGGWEDYKIGSFQARRVGGWYYAFYNAFSRQPFRSQVGLARSRDGATGWERHPDNPMLRPSLGCAWDAAMVYKPTALWDEARQRWDVWFNASAQLNGTERIGHAWRIGLW